MTFDQGESVHYVRIFKGFRLVVAKVKIFKQGGQSVTIGDANTYENIDYYDFDKDPFFGFISQTSAPNIPDFDGYEYITALGVL